MVYLKQMQMQEIAILTCTHMCMQTGSVRRAMYMYLRTYMYLCLDYT